jgi:hypothetical protein
LVPLLWNDITLRNMLHKLFGSVRLALLFEECSCFSLVISFFSTMHVSMYWEKSVSLSQHQILSIRWKFLSGSGNSINTVAWQWAEIILKIAWDFCRFAWVEILEIFSENRLNCQLEKSFHSIRLLFPWSRLHNRRTGISFHTAQLTLPKWNSSE